MNIAHIMIGSRIGYMSAAGYRQGTVENVSLAPAQSGEIVPWLIVNVDHQRKVQLCASPQSLKMLKVHSVQ